jgi:phage terminase small subunit
VKTVTKKSVVKRGKARDERPQVALALRESAVNTSGYEGAEAVDPDKPLTAMQRDFVKHWAAGESIYTSMIKAGYDDNSAGYGYRLIRQPNVLALYEKEKAAYEASVGMTRKKVMEGFLEGIEMAKLMAEPGNVIAGWREVAKMCGYYEPVKKKIDVNIKGDVVFKRMSQMSDAELLKVLQQEVTDALDQLEHDDAGDDE